MKSFTTVAVAVLGLIAAVHAGSSSAPSASKSAPYPSSVVKGATQIADGQIQATGAAKPSGIAKPTTAPKSGNSTVPFTGAGTELVAPIGGFVAALAVAIAAL